MRRYDYLLVGGGLQNGLLAAALAKFQPEARVALVDRAAELGAGHTWCFHGSDLTPPLEDAIRPFVEVQWEGYDVAFPGLTRTLNGSYHCISGQRYATALTRLFEERPHWALSLGASVRSIDERQIEFDHGERWSADLVVQSLGPERLERSSIAGYQKFVGLELALSTPCGLSRPILMDALVPQVDGYRFMYVLPLAPRRVLVEDTYFSDGADLAPDRIRTEILKYAIDRGMQIDSVLREEVGILPLPSRLPKPSASAPLHAGYQGGWFHPTTGYSFPVALRLAAVIAQSAREDVQERVAELANGHARQVRFATLLNRLLFDAFESGDRRNVFERFYRLPPPSIERFYALDTTAFDRARILCGRPPRGLSLRRVVTRGNHP